MDSQVLKYADNVKYLGFTFSSDQKDDNDILRQLKMLYTKFNRLLSLFHHCSVKLCKASTIAQLLYLFLFSFLVDSLQISSYSEIVIT